MDGVITELTLTDALFEGIEALYKEVTDESGMPYTSIAINQAELMIYLEKSDYDWEKIDVGAITPLLDASFERLGLYADYKHVLGISDYYYTYERLYSSQNFSCRTEVTSTAAKAVMSWTSPVTCRRYGTAT